MPKRVIKSPRAIAPGEVFELIGQVDKQLRQIQRQTFKQTGLTPQQYFVLFNLGRVDGQPLKDLAQMARCTRASMTSLVDTLEKKALVTRRPNPDDRRSVLVFLTRRGRGQVRSAPSLESTYGCCCSGLTPGEFMELHRLLDKLKGSLTCGPCT